MKVKNNSTTTPSILRKYVHIQLKSIEKNTVSQIRNGCFVVEDADPQVLSRVHPGIDEGCLIINEEPCLTEILGEI